MNNGLGDVGSWSFEEILALDLLTLSEHTVAAEDEFDMDSYGTRFRSALAKLKVMVARRYGQLVTHASL